MCPGVLPNACSKASATLKAESLVYLILRLIPSTTPHYHPGVGMGVRALLKKQELELCFQNWEGPDR
jgi:hypothetical protein